MLPTVLGALLPVLVTILLGFVAPWHHDFDQKQASTLNDMMLLYADIMMVALKNIVQPALVFVALRFLAYSNPIVSQAVLTTAIPTMPVLIMFATQYRVVQAESAAEVFLSSVSSVITMGGFIALTSQLS